MDIDERGVPAAWDSAPIAVAAKHDAAQRGWDGLSRARGSRRGLGAHVGVVGCAQVGARGDASDVGTGPQRREQPAPFLEVEPCRCINATRVSTRRRVHSDALPTECWQSFPSLDRTCQARSEVSSARWQPFAQQLCTMFPRSRGRFTMPSPRPTNSSPGLSNRFHAPRRPSQLQRRPKARASGRSVNSERHYRPPSSL